MKLITYFILYTISFIIDVLDMSGDLSFCSLNIDKGMCVASFTLLGIKGLMLFINFIVITIGFGLLFHSLICGFFWIPLLVITIISGLDLNCVDDCIMYTQEVEGYLSPQLMLVIFFPIFLLASASCLLILSRQTDSELKYGFFSNSITNFFILIIARKQVFYNEKYMAYSSLFYGTISFLIDIIDIVILFTLDEINGLAIFFLSTTVLGLLDRIAHMIAYVTKTVVFNDLIGCKVILLLK